MKEIRIFLASSCELEPDRARIGDLLRELNDTVYETQGIHLHLVKWEDLDLFYNQQAKQIEYDSRIPGCELFIGLFWHVAGRYTVREAEVARKSLPPENIFIFRKTAEFTPDHEGSEDEKLFLELHPEARLGELEADLETYLEDKNPIPYAAFPELREILAAKIAKYCAEVTVSEDERKRTCAADTLQIHVAASPEAEPDLARLGDLVRYLDENSKYYCRIKLIREIPGSDMFVSLCHTSAPDPLPQEIKNAIDSNSKGSGKPRLYFCMKYVPEDAKEASLKELETELGERLKHYPDRYHQSAEMKLHFLLQLEQLKRSLGREMLAVKDGMICQVSGEGKYPLLSCENMPSLQKDPDYLKLKAEREKLLAEIEKLREEDKKTEKDLSQEIYRLHQKLTEVQQQIDDKRTGHLRLARTLEEMVGREQDETISEVRELVEKGMIDEALKLLPRNSDELLQSVTEDLKAHAAKMLRHYEVCRLTIECLEAAGNLRKNRDKIFEFYDLLVDKITPALQDPQKTAAACLSYGEFLYDSACYDKALKYLEKALEIRRQVLGENHPDTATCYNNIGSAWWSKGDCDKALEYYGKALKILRQVLGEKHPDTATCYNNIGSAWHGKGDYDKALIYYGKALEIRRQVLGEKHPNTAGSYNNIGAAWRGKGDCDKALKYLEKALEIRRQVLGENHPDTATCYNNIGETWLGKGDCDKALKHHEKALKILLQVLGENHPDTASCYNNIGGAWHGKGDCDKALEYFEKALEIRRQVLGENHPDIATCYDNIGVVWYGKGDCNKALEYHEKALEIRLQALGEKHLDTAKSYNNIGETWLGKGDCDKALKHHEKALKILLQVLGENHPDTATCYNNIGKVWYDKGDYDKALGYFEKALEIRRHIFGEDHPSVAKTKEAIQAVRRKLGEKPAEK
ncbi:MAG: tetratricopeptide repeat protein [Lentisphaeria bacterium]|nr:tetratricopeptide repeat protein [Lentisphaeria bacterium]